jgi:dihydrodipicolinate synthase/N-acetylneuraminate lyase
MRTQSIEVEDLRGVFPVPPLARRNDARRSLDFDENTRLVRHIAEGGISNFIYGGNAFLYHITLADYEALIEWLSGFEAGHLAIPSAGPSYGRLMDQADMVRRRGFPIVMTLPCADPRDAAGIERGLREFADACATPLMCYIKDENNFGADKEAGLDAVGRLVDSGVCKAIKYAVVREDPSRDEYLRGLLRRVPAARVISGIGERPAVIHMRDFGLPGFTTGSGCVAPRMSQDLFEANARGDYAAAETLRSRFLPLEDLRDAWGPARVLHAATDLAGIARTGPLIPFQSPLNAGQLESLAPVAKALCEESRSASVGAK